MSPQLRSPAIRATRPQPTGSRPGGGRPSRPAGDAETGHDRCMRLLLMRRTPAELAALLADRLDATAAQRAAGRAPEGTPL